MILLDNTVISDDIAEKFFVCDISKCKGACCVEGDAGAPLDKEEIPILAEIYEQVKPYMSEAGIKAVEKKGLYEVDMDGDLATTIIDNKECAYAIYDEKNVLKCAIEQAYLDKKITWKKPISCHLYPIRIKQYGDYEALNYDRWSICSDACKLGESLAVPVYKFLKEPLIRKYGEKWYSNLEKEVKEMGL